MTKKFFTYLFFFAPIISWSQNCTTGCAWSITSTDTATLTINTGQTLCIAADGVAKGTIAVSGGTICNQGVINTSSLTCSSGSITNYGTIMYNGDLSLTTSGFSLVNNTGGTLNIMGKLTISNGGASITNHGTVNTIDNIIMSAGTITNDGTMNYPDINKTGGTNTNTGTINCCGN